MPGNILINAVDFMRNNLVMPDHNAFGSTQADSGVKSMCLVPAKISARCKGKDTPILFLRRFTGQADAVASFQAFWCPYHSKMTFTCDLDGTAALCFTATMDGCSFGFVPGAAPGTARVAHSNETGVRNSRLQHFDYAALDDFQRLEQENRLTYTLGEGATMISPPDYMFDHNNARIQKSTTFGVRTGAAWAFYTQTYAKVGKVFVLRGVTHHP